ncbi:major capsid protein [Bifidobacterium sp. SO1]|uniref:major capsid protein n=1 Tax=Bifidobacterium sp. SO1 TaxID=2809029 RepID=UPI001BDD8097|nr:major capsid protein [Bifidobacterium sp. SO1]MBT1161213.1 major capsid protein [Bifidobacterium sp. SO1]
MSGTLEKNIISPAEASGLVQGGFDFVNNLLPFSSVFPVKSNNGQTTVTWTKIIPPKETDAMKFRAWDGEAAHGKTSTSTGENYTGLIPLSKMGHISERDVITHTSDSNWIHDKASEIFTQLGQEAAVRIELARITAMVDAKITVDENGIKQNTWTFERPNTLSKLTPETVWSDVKSDPVTDVLKWVDKIRDERGRAPGAVLTTSKVIDALRLNESFITEYTGVSLANSKPRLTREEVLDVLRTACGLSDVRMIDLIYRDLEIDNGFKMPVDVNAMIPDGTFLMFPSYNDSSLGFTASGPTVEGQDPEYEINKSVNDGFVGAMFSGGAPVKYDLWANGTMMPILQEAVSTAKASVL